MYRTAARSSARLLRSAGQSATAARAGSSRRFLTTAPAAKSGTWKGAALRWGLAAGAVYWYSTSPIFADEPVASTIPAPPQFSDSDMPTVEAVVEEKRRQAELKAQKSAPPPPPAPETSELSAAIAQEEFEPGQTPEELEEEAGQQGAFNPETGEINWDCPCLGGMAHGPCGEEFKAAFSCFVYSTEEVKGVDCIDKFQHMQDCFRQYPEIYGSELADDEESDAAVPIEGAADAEPPKDMDKEAAPEISAALKGSQETQAPVAESAQPEVPQAESEPEAKPASKIIEQAAETPVSAEETMTPRKAFDATDANNHNKTQS